MNRMSEDHEAGKTRFTNRQAVVITATSLIIGGLAGAGIALFGASATCKATVVKADNVIFVYEKITARYGDALQNYILTRSPIGLDQADKDLDNLFTTLNELTPDYEQGRRDCVK